ncbi:MAG: vegetative protein [Deltaproteobacteria bacterium]|nr:vegetative protein [Deltaproteobacteria bacterium]
MADKKKKTTWRAAKGGGKKKCSIEGCKRPYRAKGFCYFHYAKWTDGALPHARYKTCNKADCKKKQFKSGLCETHYNEMKGITAAAPAAAAPAAS